MAIYRSLDDLPTQSQGFQINSGSIPKRLFPNPELLIGSTFTRDGTTPGETDTVDSSTKKHQ
jgi:hypothetical protein